MPWHTQAEDGIPMDNRIGELQVFLRVVEAGSFSEAARQLLMTPSTVSKLIARMEARLGVPIGTVKSRLSRARKRLGAQFAEHPAVPTTSGGHR